MIRIPGISAEALRKNHRLIAAAAAALLIIIIIALAASCSDKKPKKKEKPASSSQVSSSAADTAAAVTRTESTAGSKPKDMAELKTKLEGMLESEPGDWSVYIKDLSTNKTILINERTFYPASTIKLFAMAAAYQQIYDGKYVEETLFGDISAMASKSNNDSFNNLVWNMGNGYITEWCHAHGYEDTYQYSGLRPADNADGLDDPEGRTNQTSAKDIGRLLESIYKGECVSPMYSARMLNLLLEQEYRDKIPAGIPNGCAVANKTGETDDVSHDSAIVSTPNGDYIIVIMCDHPGKADDIFGYFSILSQEVYRYFEK
ncbi:beta-lactamase class A [Ruminococcus sp. YE71]|uniref:serine hydrolase n=1 Tax=unclassified Ruminococcus TaxID=2608920 RepID=UPI0008831720|nr:MULTISPECIES: serine hydrolase [unclassified Ruminococcus]SDA31804.1 beta-lactamase class A [Ruminococcus sp. YE78]SFW51889.1 beta-lactamase class A [Ruminococcus sp. YE71]